MFIKT